MKIIHGAYSTIKETTTTVDQLLKEGYRPDNITVVAKQQLIEEIQNQTLAEVEPVVTGERSTSIWDKVKNVFSNEEDSPLEKYGFDKEPTEKYTDAIKNDKFVVLVDDDTRQSSETDQETQPTVGAPTKNTMASGFGVDPVIPGVGSMPGAAKKDSGNDTPGDPDLPNVGDE